ncbi:MAG: FxsA family protein [Thiotrichales bacterium]|nr:FxsA family protein [Thiotrichales bacterium]
MKILLFLVIFPLLELYLLIQVGSEIGALTTVLYTIFTAIIGVVLIRKQGLATMMQAQTALANQQAPQEAVINGVLIFVGGVLLFVPGLISDALGFFLLIPPLRQLLVKQSLKGMVLRTHYRNRQGETIIEGEWSEKPPVQPDVLPPGNKSPD